MLPARLCPVLSSAACILGHESAAQRSTARRSAAQHSTAQRSAPRCALPLTDQSIAPGMLQEMQGSVIDKAKIAPDFQCDGQPHQCGKAT
jgi:hypothetical protein